MGRKLAVGIFSFTGDEGCVITFVEILNYKLKEWADKVEFRHFRVIKSKNSLEGLDVAFVEGAISNDKEVAKLKEIREHAKRVVAIGTCAMSGYPSNHRNFFDDARREEIRPIMERFGHREKVSGIAEFVKVDAVVPGCPIVESAFVKVMEGYLKEFGVE
jgi:coenzyme F420-reducing hydrogenase gamma subunit